MEFRDYLRVFPLFCVFPFVRLLRFGDFRAVTGPMVPMYGCSNACHLKKYDIRCDWLCYVSTSTNLSHSGWVWCILPYLSCLPTRSASQWTFIQARFWAFAILHCVILISVWRRSTPEILYRTWNEDDNATPPLCCIVPVIATNLRLVSQDPVLLEESGVWIAPLHAEGWILTQSTWVPEPSVRSRSGFVKQWWRRQ